MSNSIKLSEKYGVNPTMCKCFFCGEVKHLALLGQIGDRRKKEDIEAPKYCVMDYVPCDKCAENMKQGVTLIEVSEVQPSDKRPPLKAKGGQEVYPLDRWAVMKTEAVSRIFDIDMKAGEQLFVDSDVMNKLID